MQQVDKRDIGLKMKDSKSYEGSIGQQIEMIGQDSYNRTTPKN